MNRREWFGLIGLSAALAAHAQPSLPVVGLLWIRGGSSSRFIEAMRNALSTLGWTDGKNYRIDDRFLVDGYDRLEAAAARLSEEKVAVMVTYGTTALLAADKFAPGTPIVIAAATDPVTMGLASSLARPGGHVTGLTSFSENLAGKRLELLREMVPALRRLAVMLVAARDTEVATLRDYEALGRAARIEVQAVDVRDATAIEPAIAGISRTASQAITVVNSTLFTANRDRVVAAIDRLRIPAIYAGADFVEAGGLISYGIDVAENFRKSAAYIDKILKGAKPGDLPIEQPTRLEMVLNRRTAKSLNLNLPQSVLVRVDRVIE